MKIFITFLLLFFIFFNGLASNEYDLWLRYDKISDQTKLQNYKNQIKAICFKGNSKTLIVAKEELLNELLLLGYSKFKIFPELENLSEQILGQ